MSLNKIINNPVIAYGKELSGTILTCQAKLSVGKYLPKTKDSSFNVVSVTIEYN